MSFDNRDSFGSNLHLVKKLKNFEDTINDDEEIQLLREVSNAYLQHWHGDSKFKNKKSSMKVQNTTFDNE